MLVEGIFYAFHSMTPRLLLMFIVTWTYTTTEDTLPQGPCRDSSGVWTLLNTSIYTGGAGIEQGDLVPLLVEGREGYFFSCISFGRREADLPFGKLSVL